MTEPPKLPEGTLGATVGLMLATSAVVLVTAAAPVLIPAAIIGGLGAAAVALLRQRDGRDDRWR